MYLETTLEKPDNEGMQRIWTKCPACGHKACHYDSFSRKCYICGFILGNIKGIYMDVNNRLRFYRYGF